MGTKKTGSGGDQKDKPRDGKSIRAMRAVTAENIAASASAWYAYGMQAFEESKKMQRSRFRMVDGGRDDVLTHMSTGASGKTENAPIDFLKRRGEIMSERDPEAWEEEIRRWNAEQFRPTFERIYNAYGLGYAFDWLYDQVLFKAGLIAYEDCFPEPPLYPDDSPFN